MKGANTSATLPITASILARTIQRCRDRRGGDQVRRVLAGDREPGEAAGKLARGHHQHRHQQHEIVAVGAEGAPQQQSRAAAGREAASASARRARGRGAAASIPSGAARCAARRGGTSGRAAVEHAAVGNAGGGDGVLAEARREQRDGGGQQSNAERQHGRERGEIAEHGARRPPHDALQGGHERNQQVGFQEVKVGKRAVGQDRGDLQTRSRMSRRRSQRRSARQAACACGPMVRNSATVSATDSAAAVAPTATTTP